MNRHLMATRSSHLSSARRCGVCLMLLAAPLFLASSAYADTLSIGLQESGFNGGNILTVKTGSGAITVGPISFGTFNVNQANSQDFAVLPTPGLLNSQTLDISTSTPGVLTVWVTAQGLSFVGTQNFVSSFAVNTLSGGIVSVGETTYFSPTNGLYNGGTQIVLDSATFTAIGTKGPDTSPGTTAGTFSVTEKYVIFDTTGTGDDNLTIDLNGKTNAVPEPTSIGLIGAGAGLLGIFAKLRR